ncbi:cytochrome C [Leptolyngbya sp. 'hensonii']|uniref:c-type cytochrome n=1 Tax=Leptolyngbya sp. 'hensonii' TaxID=1922337 RepID=UPI00094FEE98|nr:cytochrome c [Leptolyngbya sp. 'hensonii']OLP16432.1 cytochrome C [Leptolyngbya sp. 'hensonii']
MDNQLVKPEILMQQVGLIVLAIILVIFLAILGIHQWQVSDPYIRAVLTLSGDPIQGHAIFQMNCSGCHGLMADGRVGPSLKNISDRKSDIGLIQQVISGKTPPMPQFQPSHQEMADLLSYLKSL